MTTKPEIDLTTALTIEDGQLLTGCFFEEDLALFGPSVGGEVSCDLQLLTTFGAKLGAEFDYATGAGEVFAVEARVREVDTRPELDDLGVGRLRRTLPDTPGDYRFSIPVTVTTRGGDRVRETTYLQSLRLVVKLACRVEIELLKSRGANEDLVQLSCDLPSQKFSRIGRARLLGGAQTDETIVLVNPDGRLRFTSGAKTKTLVLPKSGAWREFLISGEVVSKKLRDAIIEAHQGAAQGPICATKPLTVFHFEDAKLTITPSGRYGLRPAAGKAGRTTFAPQKRPAVRYESSARVVPASLDCEARPLSQICITMAQNVQSSTVTYTWKYVDKSLRCPPGDFTFKRREFYQVKLRYPGPSNDSDDAGDPVYQQNALGLAVPLGCPDGGTAKTQDTPSSTRSTLVKFDVQSEQDPAVTAEATYRLVRVQRKTEFTSWVVAFNTDTKEVCPLKERSWSIDLDSNTPGQLATVNANPLTPKTKLVTRRPFSNDVKPQKPQMTYFGKRMTIKCP